MNNFKQLVLNAICALIVLGAAEASDTGSTDWTPKRAGFVPETICESHYQYFGWLKRPFDPAKSTVGDFRLYYHFSAPFDPSKPSILYIKGGPGVIHPKLDEANCLKDSYNVVYFHIRGAGCSQFPLTRKYDQYISTKHTLTDLEALREHLGIEKWQLVAGASYGTGVAQRYATAHPERIANLLMGGAHVFWHKQIGKPEEYIRPTIIQEILRRDPANDTRGLKDSHIKRIMGEVVRIHDDTKELDDGLFELMQTQTWNRPETLRKYPSVNKSLPFLMAILLAHYTGWVGGNEKLRTDIRHMRAVFIGEFYPGLVSEDLLTAAHEALREKAVEWGFVNKETETPATPSDKDEFSYPMIGLRTYETIFFYDLEHYDYRAYVHQVPTTIIQGEADAAAPLEGAKALFRDSLKGMKQIIILKGVGHKRILSDECKHEIFEAAAQLGSSGNSVDATLFSPAGVCAQEFDVEIIFEGLSPKGNTKGHRLLPAGK